MNVFHYPELDETVYRETLECGLTVCVVPRKGFTKKLCYLVTDYGSVHDRFTLDGREYRIPAGSAHYLEHKLFDMPDGRDVSEEFAGLGASVNAFTSYDMTAYYFTCTEHFDACLRLLLDFVYTPYFTEEGVQKERGIIDQEIGMNLDSPETVVFEELTKSLYRTHPIRNPILGTPESIREITPDTLRLIHRAFYTPGNMMLCVLGDVEPEAAAELARQRLGTEYRPPAEKREPKEADASPLRRLTRKKMEVAMPTFCMAFRAEPSGKGEAAIRRELAAELASEALFGESSELYLRLYDEGLIDSSFGGGFETLDGCAMLLCSGDSRDPEAVARAVLEQSRKLLKEGILQEDFLRMQRGSLGRRIRGLDSFDSTCFRLCAYHFSGFDYFRFPEVFRQITPEEILALLEAVCVPERCALSIIDPIFQEEHP